MWRGPDSAGPFGESQVSIESRTSFDCILGASKKDETKEFGCALQITAQQVGGGQTRPAVVQKCLSFRVSYESIGQ